MPRFDPSMLRPAEHVDEPPAVLEGWRAADVSDDELVDDDVIIADPGNDLVARPVVEDGDV